MLTYEYECGACGSRFERRQAMTEAPETTCPDCGGPVRRVVSGGWGFLVKEPGPARGTERGAGCSRETTGRTCCGRDERCDKPPCGGRS